MGFTTRLDGISWWFRQVFPTVTLFLINRKKDVPSFLCGGLLDPVKHLGCAITSYCVTKFMNSSSFTEISDV